MLEFIIKLIMLLFITSCSTTTLDRNSYFRGCYDAKIEHYQIEQNQNTNGQSIFVFKYQKRYANAKCQMKARSI